MISTNLKAFLSMIAVSEGTKDKSDDGYNVLVGGALFDNGYVDHPRVLVDLPNFGIKSSAAGRYQILAKYFDVYKAQLNLPDFGHDSQDAIAIQMIKECDALDDIEAGDIDAAISKCRSRWASFPGAMYGQYEQQLSTLRGAFAAAGGTISDEA